MRKLLILIAAFACAGHAQTTNLERRAKLPREIRDLLDRAPAAPPELEADILLHLVEAGRIADKELGVEIIEDAFARAGSARFSMPLIAATDQGYWTDSDVGVRWAALDLHLDTLSLRCRAIQAMVRLNRRRALELFQSLPVRIPARTCSDAMVDRVDEFYPTLALVVSRGFTEAEQRENKHLEFAESYIRSMVAPAQLEPAAKTIADLHLDGKHLQPMLAAYTSALHEMSADDRAFSSATNQGLLESLVRLANESQAKGISSFELAAAFRTYYVHHMRAARCEDNIDLKDARARIARSAESFNSDLLPLADPEGKQIQAIKADESQPDKAEGHAEVYQFWSKPETRKLLEDLKHLRFGTAEQLAANNKNGPRPDGRAQFLSVEQRKTLAWQIEAREYLNEVESWSKSHDETEENYFHQVCFIYGPFLELVPPGELWDNVLDSYISFLKQTALAKANPAEWYLEVKRLLELEDAEPGARDKVVTMVQNKGDIVMSMYAELTRLAAPHPAR